MSLDFCAVDFETAMPCHASAIQIGLAKVRNGEITETLEAHIRPAPGFEIIQKKQFEAHRIPQRIVNQAPSWTEVFPEIQAFIGEDTLVSHSVQFDGDVMAETCASHGFSAPRWQYGDSMKWAGALLGRENSSLTKAAQALAIPFKETHDALNDVIACAYITTALAHRVGYGCISDMFRVAPMRTNFEINLKPNHEICEQQNATNSYIDSVIANRRFIPESLEGSGVLFTGDLSIDRDRAKAIAASCGASPKSTCSSKVNVVVIGEQFCSTLRGHVVSSKLRNAIAMFDKGEDITFITEDEFYSLTNHEDLIRTCHSRPQSGGPVPFSCLEDRVSTIPW